jgi:NAD(P)-dependent dehydrogenase (short-subunit alcohol dehydrogenase family)
VELKVVVNDLGGSVDGSGGSASAAELVAQEIIAAGGEAIANGASVTDLASVQSMVDEVMAKWGRIDILVNNAGILRDKHILESSNSKTGMRSSMCTSLAASTPQNVCGQSWWSKDTAG